ncbi:MULTISPECIES: hypothetical protein [Rhodomicrobium]|uniref:hypothetical protein n=1 Tax=Rhodomicrobium TaxID=1068 RepID=UPI000B4A9672|nr:MULTISPECIES: hypothetical protein [Rhodomicrobium]
MKLDARIEGLGAFGDALERIADPSGLAEVLETAAESICGAARVKLADGQPPDSRSGALAASLTVEAASDGAGYKVGTPLDYGWHLEFGSLGRAATPWLEPSLDDARPGIVDAVKRWLAAPGKP